jgi:hypothetical protein
MGLPKLNWAAAGKSTQPLATPVGLPLAPGASTVGRKYVCSYSPIPPDCFRQEAWRKYTAQPV